MYPFWWGASYVAFASTVVGIMRKGGYIEFQMAYFQRIMFSDAFLNLTYILSIAGCHKNIFINSPILISAVSILGREFKQILVAKPRAPILSICYF